MASNWQTHKTTLVYDNPWISVTHREVTAPTGTAGIYGVVHFKNSAIAIIPIDSDGNTWLVGQQRYPTEHYSWEVPEGGALHRESGLRAAQRELREETGIVAGMWTSLAYSHLSNSVSDETAVAFVARDLSFTHTDLDDTELLELKKLPLADAIEMAMNGSITDALSLLALLKLKALIDDGMLLI